MPATKLNLERTRRLLDKFRWADLFIEELGWNSPSAGTEPMEIREASDVFTLEPIAHLGGAWVFVVTSSTELIPDAKARLALHKATVSRQREHLFIFQDAQRRQTLWSWPRYEGSSIQARTHLYVQGQPGDLFLSKLSNIYFEIDEFNESGDADLLTVTERLKKALDVRPVTREFYKVFSQQQLSVVAAVQGLSDEPHRRHYASVLLTRLMFVYFLQKKGLLDKRNGDYLEGKLAEHRAWAATQPGTPPTFYRRFLRELFFQGFALAPNHRKPEVAALLGTIPYLNGGLFLPHALEHDHPNLDLPDEAVQHLLGVFTSFSWSLDDRLGGKDNEINPDVLGYIFEKYINSNSSKQKGAGAFYTPTEITTYLCDKTVDGLLLRACNDAEDQLAVPGRKPYRFATLDELLLHLDDRLAKKLLSQVLPELSLLDPACGSGAFLVAALKKLETVYAAVVGYVQVSAVDDWLKNWLAEARQHASLGYFIKKEIITRNLYGLDLMDEAVEIARLRLFLALVASAQKPEDLEPLPNIDFNLMEGNGLVGLLHIKEADFQRYSKQDLFAPQYKDLLTKKNRLIDRYKGVTAGGTLADTDMVPLRDEIQAQLDRDRDSLNQVMHAHMQAAKIGFQQAQWDVAKGKETYKKGKLTTAHIQELRPFHWGYEFDRVLESGGFDAIIANPPWETFKPNSKEFFEEYADVITKRGMSIDDFEKKKAELLQEPNVRQAWEAYCSRFPYVSEMFRKSPDYTAQVAKANGKATGSDLNLYKLFLERCFRLLRPKGACGIIVPTGLYTDIGAKGLRQLLFDETRMMALFGLSNERKLFEDVDHRFKYAILIFEKEGSTKEFAAAFRIQPREAIGKDDLDRLLRDPAQQVRIATDTVRLLSPDALSIFEYRNEADQRFTEKVAAFPSLDRSPALGGWGLELTNGFHSSKTSLPKPEPGEGRLPFLWGENITHFNYLSKPVQEWADEQEARVDLIGKTGQESGQQLYYQRYTLVYRRIGRSSDTRTLYTTIIPPGVFIHESLTMVCSTHEPVELLFLTAVLNSYIIDSLLGQRVSANLSHHFIYPLPVPRPDTSDPQFQRIARISAQLICTTPAFNELAIAGGLAGYEDSVTDSDARDELRAELDARIAHLYGLTDMEYAHALESFDKVKAAAKEATLAAFHMQQPDPDEAAVEALIFGKGEGPNLEFKCGAYYNSFHKKLDSTMLINVVETVAAFFNSPDGGTLLLGVADKPVHIVGIEDDLSFKFPKQKEPEDAYGLALSQAITKALGAHIADLFTLSFLTVKGRRLCRIAVRPANAPVYLDGDMHIRSPRGKQKLKTDEAMEYVKRRFPKT